MLTSGPRTPAARYGIDQLAAAGAGLAPACCRQGHPRRAQDAHRQHTGAGGAERPHPARLVPDGHHRRRGPADPVRQDLELECSRSGLLSQVTSQRNVHTVLSGLPIVHASPFRRAVHSVPVSASWLRAGRGRPAARSRPRRAAVSSSAPAGAPSCPACPRSLSLHVNELKRPTREPTVSGLKPFTRRHTGAPYPGAGWSPAPWRPQRWA